MRWWWRNLWRICVRHVHQNGHTESNNEIIMAKQFRCHDIVILHARAMRAFESSAISFDKRFSSSAVSINKIFYTMSWVCCLLQRHWYSSLTEQGAFDSMHASRVCKFIVRVWVNQFIIEKWFLKKTKINYMAPEFQIVSACAINRSRENYMTPRIRTVISFDITTLFHFHTQTFRYSSKLIYLENLRKVCRFFSLLIFSFVWWLWRRWRTSLAFNASLCTFCPWCACALAKRFHFNSSFVGDACIYWCVEFQWNEKKKRARLDVRDKKIKCEMGEERERVGGRAGSEREWRRGNIIMLFFYVQNLCCRSTSSHIQWDVRP